MKSKLLTLAGMLALIAVAGKYYEVPLMAQVRAALVSDVDNPARNSVRLNLDVAQPQGIGSAIICFETGYTVPAGKRLVIDDVSARTSVGLSTVAGMFTELTTNLASLGGNCGAGSFSTKKHIAVVPFTSQFFDAFGTRYSAAHERTQFFVDTGELLGLEVWNSALVHNDLIYKVNISGHLVSLP